MFHNLIAQLEMLLFIYFNFQILREKSRRQQCLEWIITGISCFKSKLIVVVILLIIIIIIIIMPKHYTFPTQNYCGNGGKTTLML